MKPPVGEDSSLPVGNILDYSESLPYQSIQAGWDKASFRRVFIAMQSIEAAMHSSSISGVSNAQPGTTINLAQILGSSEFTLSEHIPCVVFKDLRSFPTTFNDQFSVAALCVGTFSMAFCPWPSGTFHPGDDLFRGWSVTPES